MRRLDADSGTQFDPVVVKSFISIASVQVANVFAATGISAAIVF
jgi:HD-GYP domain-containing protein (c-di-GMP phosphodiesterase class II)